MAFQYLSVLALAALASAEVCSISGTTTISSAAQATALATCNTFTGSISIAKGTTEQIALDGITHLKGNLIANDVAQLTSLSADSLAVIDKTFYLENCPQLSNLNFPSLTQVSILKWQGLASLSGLSFTSTVQLANTVQIDNTMLGSLDGISLEQVGFMQITNNKYLNSIEMPLGNISTGFTIQGNGRSLTLGLPNLVWANMLNIQNATTIDLSSLSSVNGSLGFYSNFVDSIACPNLTYVGQELAIDNNAQLTNTSFPELKSIIGGFQIQNNTGYEDVTGFDKVATIGGAISFHGVFKSVELPALKSVRGGFSVLSSNDIQSDCNKFQKLQSEALIQGPYYCHGSDPKAPTTTTGSGGTGSGSSPQGSTSASSTPNAASTVYITGTTGLLGVVAALFGML